MAAQSKPAQLGPWGKATAGAAGAAFANVLVYPLDLCVHPSFFALFQPADTDFVRTTASRQNFKSKSRSPPTSKSKRLRPAVRFTTREHGTPSPRSRMPRVSRVFMLAWAERYWVSPRATSPTSTGIRLSARFISSTKNRSTPRPPLSCPLAPLPVRSASFSPSQSRSSPPASKRRTRRTGRA